MSKKGSFGKSILNGALVIMLAIALYSVIILIDFDKNLSNSINMPANPPKEGGIVNILFLGMDVGDVNNKENDAIKRTDTIMLLNYNPKTKRCNLVSIPRDMLIKVRSSSGIGRNAKINSAYGLVGEESLVSYVEEFTQTKINYIVKLNYEGFNEIVDAIGGVDMEMKNDMNYDDNVQDLHIHFEKGKKYHLDGKSSEEFFRWRKNNDGTGLENGDLGRIENQQEFMKKIISKVTSPLIITKLPKLLDIIPKYVKTNMNAKDMLSYAWKVRYAKDGVNMEVLKGKPKTINNIEYLVYDKKLNEDLISKLKGELKVTERGKDEFKIMVLNATGTGGLATKVCSELNLKGWTNVDTGNIETTETSSIMLKYDELKEVLPKESRVLNIIEFNSEEYIDYDAVIVLGKDYEG